MSTSLTLPSPLFILDSYQGLTWRERSKRNLLHKGGTTTMICDTTLKQIFISWNIFWQYFYVKRQASFLFWVKNGDASLKCILKGNSTEIPSLYASFLDQNLYKRILYFWPYSDTSWYRLPQNAAELNLQKIWTWTVL